MWILRTFRFREWTAYLQLISAHCTATHEIHTRISYKHRKCLLYADWQKCIRLPNSQPMQFAPRRWRRQYECLSYIYGNAFYHLIYYSRWELNFRENHKRTRAEKRGKIFLNVCERIWSRGDSKKYFCIKREIAIAHEMEWKFASSVCHTQVMETNE